MTNSYIKFIVLSITLLIVLINGKLTTELCQSYDESKLYQESLFISNKVDDILVPDVFAKVVTGVMVVIVDEDDGEEAGGGTNTAGSYQTFIFNGTEIFPDGICDIPGNEGGPRCDPDTGSTISFLLGPTDAISFVGCTPPPMKYFSYDVIIDARLTEEYPFYPGQPFGDDLSHMNINVSATESQSQSIFDQPFVVVHTADGESAQATLDAYVATGDIKESAVNTREISSSTVRFWDRANGATWYDSKPDILSLVSRLSVPLPDYVDAYESYKKVVWPVKLYFGYDDNAAKEPLEPILKPRYSKDVVNEVDLLLAAFEQLKSNVVTSLTCSQQDCELGLGAEHVGTQYVNLTEEGYYDDWDFILERKDNSSFVVPTRDATYGLPLCLSDAACKLEKNTAAVVVGVLHSAVLDAAYSSVGVSVMNVLTGMYSETHWILDEGLVGSADRYLKNTSSLSEVSDSLFAVDFLPSGKCSTRPSDQQQWCFEWDDISFGKLNFPYIILGERIYAVSETGLGPPANTTIGSELLMFAT